MYSLFPEFRTSISQFLPENNENGGLFQEYDLSDKILFYFALLLLIL